jgi:PKD repeat protein
MFNQKYIIKLMSWFDLKRSIDNSFSRHRNSMKYITLFMIIIVLISQSALALLPRCDEVDSKYNCVANDIDNLHAYMVPVTSTTMNIYLDIHMQNERERVYIIYDVIKSDGTSPITDGQACLHGDGCPRWTSGVLDGKWSMGNLIGQITNYDSTKTYTLTHILFLWDQMSSCPGTCGSSCSDYQTSKCKNNIGSFVIYPPLDILVTNYNICLGGSQVLDITPKGGSPSVPGSGGTYIYSWSPATALSSTTIEDPTASPTSSIKYTVTITDSLTLKSISKDVWVYVNPLPTAEFSAAPLSGCSPLTVTFTDGSTVPLGSINKWEWDFNNDLIIDWTDYTVPAPFTHTYTTPGTYSVLLKVYTDKGCTNTKLRSNYITVNPLPDCTITAPESVCSGSTGNTASVADAGSGATYAWEITGGTITSATPYTRQITWNAGSSGTATLKVTVTTAGGCTMPQCSKVIPILNNPIVFAGNDQDVCDNVASITLTGTNSGGPASYLWTSSGTGTFDPVPATSLSENYYPSAADKAAGSVAITLTATGCSANSEDSIILTIWEIPIPNIDVLIT